MNIEKYKNNIIESLRKNKLGKNYKIYKLIINSYDKFPETIKEILNILPNITYYKDYFNILILSKNELLNNVIYDIIYRKINEDIINYNNNKEISTLAKWMPRKGLSIDRKINFVNEFCSRYYKEKDHFTALIKYKKTITILTKKINPIEINLCQKTYDNITNITYQNTKTYHKVIQKDEIKDKIKNIIIDNYNSKNYEDIIIYAYNLLKNKNIIKKNKQNENNKNIDEIDEINKNYLNEYFKNNYKKYLDMYKKILDNNTLAIDFDNIFINEYINEFIMFIILFLYKYEKVYICGLNNWIIKKDNLNDNINMIINSIISINNINIKELQENINGKIILLTNKKIIKNDKISCVNFNGLKKIFNIHKKEIPIKNILNNSREIHQYKIYKLKIIISLFLIFICIYSIFFYFNKIFIK